MESSCVRLIDYFVVCGLPKTLRPVEPLTEDTDVCEIAFHPDVLDRYPESDLSDTPLPETFPLFAFPNNIHLYSAPLSPRLHSCILTGGDGSHVYVVGVLFYDPFRIEDVENVSIHNPSLYAPPPTPLLTRGQSMYVKRPKHVLGPLSEKTKDKFRFRRGERGPIRLFAPKCLCFVSHYDLSSSFRALLALIIQLGYSRSPYLETFIRRIVREIPVPPRGRVSVDVIVGESSAIRFSRSPPNILPENPHIIQVFAHLDVTAFLLIFCALLTENKVALFHRSPAVLSAVAQGMIRALFPLRWPHVFIPVLPFGLHDFLYAPMPFVIGLPTDDTTEDLRDTKVLPDDVVGVDLTRGKVSVPNQFEIPLLPHQRVKLLKALQKFASPAFHSNSVPVADSLTDVMPPMSVTGGEHRRVDANLRSLESIAKRSELDIETSGVSASKSSPSLHRTSSRSPSPTRHVGYDEKKVREAFLRFFVSLLLRYRQFIRTEAIEGGNQQQTLKAVFDIPGFLKDAHDSDKPFLKILVDTQAFHYFIQQRTKCAEEDDTLTSEVLPLNILHDIALFDESISVKLNRSRLRTSKLLTPFLLDSRFEHSQVYNCSLPEVTMEKKREKQQIPRKDICFLRLQRNRFGSVKYVAPLIEDQNDFDSAFLASVQNNPYLEKIIKGREERRKRWEQKLRDKEVVFLNPIQEKQMRKSVAKIARYYLRFCARRHFLTLRGHSLSIQARIKARNQRIEFLLLRRSCVRITAWWRMSVQRREFLHLCDAVVKIVALVRGVQQRRRTNELLESNIMNLQQSVISSWNSGGPKDRPSLVRCSNVFLSIFRQHSLLLRHSHLRDIAEEASVGYGKDERKQAVKDFKSLYKLVKKHVPSSLLSNFLDMCGIDVKGKRRKKQLLDSLFTSASEDSLRLAANLVLQIHGLPNSQIALRELVTS